MRLICSILIGWRLSQPLEIIITPKLTLGLFSWLKERNKKLPKNNQLPLNWMKLFALLFAPFIQKPLNNTIRSKSLSPGWLTHRLVIDKVHRLFDTLSFFRSDRFVQFLSLIPVLILLLYLLVSTLRGPTVHWRGAKFCVCMFRDSKNKS